MVVVAESEEALSRGVRMVEDILFDPDHARELKRQQLAALAESNGTGGGGSGGPRTTNFGGLYGPGAGTSVEIMVATSIVGKIIGRGGETIRELQDRTGARIQVQKDTDVPPGVTERRITVIGNDSDVARAKEEIMRIIQDREREMQAMSGGGGGRRDGARGGAASIQIQIPNQHVGLIIGRAGATVNALQVRTSTHIDIPSGPDMDNPGVRTTVISGPTLQACEAARAEIEGLIASDARGGFGGGGGGGYGAPPGPAVYIQVPDEAVGMVIGRGGENVRGLEMRTGTRIQIPHHPDPGSNPPVRTVMISGPPQACEAARQEIWQVSQMPPGSHWHGGPGGGGGGGGMPYGGGGGGAQPYPSQAFDPYAGVRGTGGWAGRFAYTRLTPRAHTRPVTHSSTSSSNSNSRTSSRTSSSSSNRSSSTARPSRPLRVRLPVVRRAQAWTRQSVSVSGMSTTSSTTLLMGTSTTLSHGRPGPWQVLQPLLRSRAHRHRLLRRRLVCARWAFQVLGRNSG